jgi:hypothetical protein
VPERWSLISTAICFTDQATIRPVFHNRTANFLNLILVDVLFLNYTAVLACRMRLTLVTL